MVHARDSAVSSFILELFRQANEHSRETDRKRNILLGSYLVVVGIGIGWLVNVWSKDADSTILAWLAPSILVILLLLGLPVLRAVILYRGWHAHYANVCKAVQWSLAHNVSLYEAACELIRDSSNRCEYFSPRGVEFSLYVFVFVLWDILLGTLVGTVLLMRFSFPLRSVVLVSALAFAGVLGLGIWCYRHHLLGQQKRFPMDSWMIIRPATEPEPNRDQ